MLDGYGLHQLTWDTCDERFGDMLVASPADAQGRGISLAVRQNGAAANLTGATVYLVWRHKVTGERGTEPFTAVNAASGTFSVYYPAAMQEAEGAVQAQFMISRGDDTYISSRVFTIRVEPIIVGGGEHEDGFTLFVDAINAYEHATEITTDAAQAATAAAGAADNARESLVAAAERGDFDGADGHDGADGFSPIATVTQTSEGATISITDKNGTTTADIAKGAKGDTGATGPQGPKGETGEQGPQGIQGEVGPRGETGATGATGAQGPQGIQGEIGPQGATGPAGADGSDGVSCTHSWNGTVLSVTSASGTSSADLVGPQGPQGPAGADGTDGADGADGTDGPMWWFGTGVPSCAENGAASGSFDRYRYADVKVGDFCYNTLADTLVEVTNVTPQAYSISIGYKGVTQPSRLRGIIPTDVLDLAPGVSGSATTDVMDHAVYAGTLLLNKTSGNLMVATASSNARGAGFGVSVSATGLANIYNANVSGGATYTASSPLSIDANDVISIDLSAYAALAGATFTGAVSGIAPTADAHFATKKYVDDAIAALDDLSGVSF